MLQVQTCLVDANRLSREGLLRILEGSQFNVVHDVSDLDQLRRALSQEAATQPDLVLVDCSPDYDRVRGDLAELQDLCPDARIVALSAGRDAELLITCFNAAIDGCILKDISCEALIESLNLVLLGERIFPSELIGLLMRNGSHQFDSVQPMQSEGARLSEREVQILQCLVAGDANKVIANRLNVTEATVKVHLKSILRKINVRNRTQAAIWALNHGMRVGEDHRVKM